MKLCEECGREGSRNYEETATGLRCSAREACAERVERRRLSTGLHRIERSGRNGDYHVYKLDGEWVPGVTTIVKDTVPAPALVDWAARVTARYAADHLDTLWGMRHLGLDAIYSVLESKPRSERDSAGARGSQLHLWAEDMIHGREVKVSSELLPWVLSVRDFLEDWEPKPVLLETAVGSRKHGYAGTLDLVADFPEIQLPNGVRYPAARRIVDYKSSRRIYAEISLQLAGYSGADVYLDAAGEEHSVAELGIAETGFAVHIRPEGYRLQPVYCGREAQSAFARLTWVRSLLKRGGTLDQWLGDPLPAPTKGTA